jgi:hypothetical protein
MTAKPHDSTHTILYPPESWKLNLEWDFVDGACPRTLRSPAG